MKTKTTTIGGRVVATDSTGRAWLAGVTADGQPLCSHMWITLRLPVQVGEQVEVACIVKRGRYVPAGD